MNRVLSLSDSFPNLELAIYDVASEQARLEVLRQDSKQFLLTALKDE